MAILKRGYRPNFQRSEMSVSKGNFHNNSGIRVFHSSSARKARKLSSKHGSALSKTRTPSPSNPRVPRFDPTAYIEQKKKKNFERSMHTRYVSFGLKS